jgi:hypothetical protein
MFDALAELILQVETNSYRFENFCIALVGKHEGVKYLPTSQSWDMGRDGRASHRGMGTHANILCATLNENLDGKSEADVLRLTASATRTEISSRSSTELSFRRFALRSSRTTPELPPAPDSAWPFSRSALRKARNSGTNF